MAFQGATHVPGGHERRKLVELDAVRRTLNQKDVENARAMLWRTLAALDAAETEGGTAA
jgi:hypothetical protein